MVYSLSNLTKIVYNMYLSKIYISRRVIGVK